MCIYVYNKIWKFSKNNLAVPRSHSTAWRKWRQMFETGLEAEDWAGGNPLDRWKKTTRNPGTAQMVDFLDGDGETGDGTTL